MPPPNQLDDHADAIRRAAIAAGLITRAGTRSDPQLIRSYEGPSPFLSALRRVLEAIDEGDALTVHGDDWDSDLVYAAGILVGQTRPRPSDTVVVRLGTGEILELSRDDYSVHVEPALVRASVRINGARYTNVEVTTSIDGHQFPVSAFSYGTKAAETPPPVLRKSRWEMILDGDVIG